jgi:uncharacterized protein (DUF488 family)
MLLAIGFGDRSTEQFVEILRRHGVKFLVDVRSRRFSKLRPGFSKDALEAVLRCEGIAYIFMGDCLGGMPDDPACNTDGKVDYAKVREQGWFIGGQDTLVAGLRDGRAIAVMCAELEPGRCHRSKLIGEAMAARGVPVAHIDAAGDMTTHEAVMACLDRGRGLLFEIERTMPRQSYWSIPRDEPQI